MELDRISSTKVKAEFKDFDLAKIPIQIFHLTILGFNKIKP